MQKRIDGKQRPRAELEQLTLARREDYAGLWRMLGRDAAYVQQFIKSGVPRRLAKQDRARLARYFGVGEVLLGGPASPVPASSGLTAIPRFNVHASAGPGAFADAEQTVSHAGFDAKFLR